MKSADYIQTYKFLNSYGKAVVREIKARIKRDKLIDTGDLYRSINYEIIDSYGTNPREEVNLNMVLVYLLNMECIKIKEQFI